MNNQHNDISDNEIRIIVSSPRIKTPPPRQLPPQKPRRKSRALIMLVAIVAVVLVTTMLLMAFSFSPAGLSAPDYSETPEQFSEPEPESNSADAPLSAQSHGKVIAVDTTVNDIPLLILTPVGLQPSLVIGNESLGDNDIRLATQAADVRADNGEIAGAFVIDGQLMSKGDAKAGFCSIVDGKITIGVADATPMFEEALTHDGSFFRQYPLVVGGQIVENKPKGKAIRKSLAEIGGEISVVMTRERLTFHDFSQTLIDIGASNAIYLVGADSYGFYLSDRDSRIATGSQPIDNPYISYIIWQ